MGVYRYLIKTPYVHGFRPETEKFDFNQTVYHQKGHEKSRMVQISTPWHLPVKSCEAERNLITAPYCTTN